MLAACKTLALADKLRTASAQGKFARKQGSTQANTAAPTALTRAAIFSCAAGHP
jgi:hypothetical protein